MNDDDSPSGVRLQKVLAAAGYGSRRECETLITEGRVEIDGKVADELGVRVNPQTQKIHVDGVPVKAPRMRYYLLNKPKGVLSTSRDPAGRPRAIDLVPEEERVFTVGRLDKESEGLLLLTNDGELANRLAHPRYGVPKTYLVAVQGEPDEATLRQLKEGVPLAEGIARVASYKVRKKTSNFTELELTLQEGKNREVRRIFAKLGHKVLRLRRISLGPLRLGQIPVGAHRELTREELDKLREAAGSIPARKRSSRPGTPNSRQVLEQGKRKAFRRSFEEGAEGVPSGGRPARPGGSRPEGARPGGYGKRPGPGGPPGARGKFAGRRPTGQGFRPVGEGPRPTGAGRRPVGEGRPFGQGRPGARPGRPTGYVRDEGDGPRPRKKFAGTRPAPNGPAGARPAGGPPSGSRPPGKRPAPPRAGGARPSGARPTGPRPGGARPAGSGPAGSRPASGRPAGGAPYGKRPVGDRPAGGRPAGGRPMGEAPGKRAGKKAPPRPGAPKKKTGGPPLPLSKRLKKSDDDD